MYFYSSDEQTMIMHFILQLILCIVTLFIKADNIEYAICGNAIASILAYFRRRSSIRLWYSVNPIVSIMKIAGWGLGIPFSNHICILLQIIALFYFRYWLMYFECEITGAYEVGYKEFRLQNQKQTAISVFYPCFYDTASEKREPQVKWFRDGCTSLKGFCMAWTFGKQSTKYEEIIHSDTLIFNMKVHLRAPFHDDFVKGYKKMMPIIFSPGIMGTRTLSSNICRNLASHGCIVYSIEHTDGTACYYNIPSSDTNPHNYIVTYKKEFGISEEDHRINEIKLRISEIKDLITYIKLNNDYINTSQFGICGFSFGAMTALEANYQIIDIKYSISLDPYFRPRWKEVLGDSNLFSTTKPYLIINSSMWHDNSIFTTDFPSWKTVCEFHKNNLNFVDLQLPTIIKISYNIRFLISFV